MNCFMGYNPLVAKEVKITTWIKEFDGESPSYPSFPNDGDCFVVFATDEDALTHNALSKKTYTNGEWADAEGGSTPTGTITITENGEGIDVSEYAYADVNVSGGGGATIPTITLSGDPETGFTYTCDIGYDGWRSAISNSPYSGAHGTELPCYAENMGLLVSKNLDDNIQAVADKVTLVFYSDGTAEVGGK